MLNKTKFALAAALMAIAPLACADYAEVKISNLNLSVSGGQWWKWLPTDAGWLEPPTAGTIAGLSNPRFDDSATDWHAKALSSTVQDGASQAWSQMTAKTSDDINGVTALASVNVSGGQAGWADTKVFEGQIMVGGHATITLSAQLDSIKAIGNMAQANAFIEMCSIDPTVKEFFCGALDYSYAEAFVDASSPAYSGPSILKASWTNPGDTTYAKMRLRINASAESVAAPLPEPATLALCAVGLAGAGFSRRRRA